MSVENLIERWATVKGHEDYEVSTLGSVRRATPSRGTVVGRLMKQQADASGYLRVSFPVSRHGVLAVRVHRLVVSAFIREMSKGEEVNHLDFNRTNNRLENLEITTRRGNIRHRNASGRVKFCHGEAHPFVKFSDDDVREMRRLRKAGESFGKIAKRFNTRAGSVFNIVRGISRRHVQ